MEAAAPCLPLVGGQGRLVVDCVEAGRADGLDGFARMLSTRALDLAAAVADESQSILLDERRMVLQVFLGDYAAAEESDLRKDSRMLQGDHPRLHSAHRQARQCTVSGICHSAEMTVYKRDDILDKYPGEAYKGGLVHRSAGAVLHRERPRGFTVFHNDDERQAFVFGEQIVEDPAAAALTAPAGLILSVTVLEVQHRITHRQVVVVLWRRVDEKVPLAAGDIGMDIKLADLAVRDVLKGVDVLVMGREFKLGALGAGPEEELAGRVRHFGTVYHQCVIVVAFVERLCGRARPVALLVLGHWE